MNVVRKEYTTIEKIKRCSYCNKILDKKKPWYYANDKVYCSDNDRYYAISNLIKDLDQKYYKFI